MNWIAACGSINAPVAGCEWIRPITVAEADRQTTETKRALPAQNLLVDEFCIKHDENNIDLKQKFEKIKKLRSENLPTVPSTLEDELKSNIFLRCDKNDLKIKLNMKNQEDFKVFKKVRDLKDSF